MNSLKGYNTGGLPTQSTCKLCGSSRNNFSMLRSTIRHRYRACSTKFSKFTDDRRAQGLNYAVFSPGESLAAYAERCIRTASKAPVRRNAIGLEPDPPLDMEYEEQAAGPSSASSHQSTALPHPTPATQPAQPVGPSGRAKAPRKHGFKAPPGP